MQPEKQLSTTSKPIFDSFRTTPSSESIYVTKLTLALKPYYTASFGVRLIKNGYNTATNSV